MANLPVYSSSAISRSQVILYSFRLSGDTCLNPAAGFSLQLIAAIIKGDWLIFVRDVWPLVLPSALGGILGGYFTLKFYEPLLLYIKYKDLAEGGEGEEEFDEEGEQEVSKNKNSTMIED